VGCVPSAPTHHIGEDVLAIEPCGWIPYLGTGVRIRHNVHEYPKRIYFRPFCASGRRFAAEVKDRFYGAKKPKGPLELIQVELTFAPSQNEGVRINLGHDVVADLPHPAHHGESRQEGP
jgi:hypothetical protein